MRTILRTTLATLLLAAGLLVGTAGFATPPPAAAAGAQLYSGKIEYSGIVNCQSIIWGSPLAEYGIGTYLGFYADPETGQPGVNQSFYLELHVAGLGNSCGGQRVGLDLALPAGVTTAITGADPVRCWADTTQLAANECPQTLPASGTHPGAVWIPSPDTAHARSWPVPQGRTWTFRIPVRSSTTLSNATATAFVQALDGWSNPVLQPTVGLYVFNGSATSVLYPSPSTAFTPVPNSANFTVKSSAYIFKPIAQTGTVFFDIAATADFATILFTDSGAVPSGQQALLAWTDWVPPSGPFAVQPNTTYYWRARYVPSSGSPVVGVTQTFRSPSNGNNVVGNGTAASCTLAALKAAFNPYTQRVEFDCGPNPVSFQLDTTYITGGPLEIDGKGKVTLVAKPGSRIFQHDGGNLVLRGLTLTGGNPGNACGGALQILNGTATLDRVRITNSAAAWGGGLCVMDGTSAEIYDSAFTGNTAADGGGGIYAGGNVTLMRSEVSGNTANTSGGGGVYTDATYFDAFYSLFAGNTANGATYGRGGGLLLESGTYGNVTTSTFSGNTAVKGGGIHNEGDTWVTSATIAYNTSTSGRGAGIESETTGFAAVLHLRNTIVANNTVAGATANCAASSAFRQFISHGSNLVSDGTCNFNEAGDLQNTDPKLRPLSQNGGGTRTHALPVSSPAVDSADNTYCAMYDQRGVNDGSTTDAVWRVLDSDGNGSKICDRGAYELVPGPVFTALAPARLMETRPANGATNPATGLSTNSLLTVDGESQNIGLRAAGSTTELRIAGRAGVPADALAASLNITATGAASGGWVTVFPCGTAMPSTSTLNLQAGVTVANAATIALGTDGKVCVFTSAATNVIVDVNGYMPAASRYGALRPARLMDTRPAGTTDDGVAQGGGALAPDTARTLQITGRGGVPNGAAAVMLNVTATGATGTTFVTVYPCGTPPATSNINLAAGVSVPNAVLVGLSGAGTVCVVANSTVHVIVDVVGYVPAGTSLAALAPARLLDSRPGSTTPPDDGVNTVRAAGSVTEVQVAGRGGVSAGATSVFLNVTAVGAAGGGYLTVFPCDQPQPNASNLNFVAGVNRANFVAVRVPASGPKAGKVCIFTSQQTNLLADVLGQVV